MEVAKIFVRCLDCGAQGSLRGPLSRATFVLATMTSCPCGGMHETLPSAASHVTILKGEQK